MFAAVTYFLGEIINNSNVGLDHYYYSWDVFLSCVNILLQKRKFLFLDDHLFIWKLKNCQKFL